MCFFHLSQRSHGKPGYTFRPISCNLQVFISNPYSPYVNVHEVFYFFIAYHTGRVTT